MSANRIIAGIAGAGFLFACWVGCNAPQQKPTPGDLPALGNENIQPRVSATTYFAHGHLLERQSQFERAVLQYREAIRLRPDFVTARNRLGITYNKLGKHADATTEFQAAIARQPGSAFLYNNLGFSLYLENRCSEAEAALDRALELRPTFSRARMNHGVVLAKLGRFDEAFNEFALVGSQSDAHYNIAMIQADAGRYPEAARSLEAALQINPQLEPAREKLAQVSQLLALQTGAPIPHSDMTIAALADADEPEFMTQSQPIPAPAPTVAPRRAAAPAATPARTPGITVTAVTPPNAATPAARPAPRPATTTTITPAPAVIAPPAKVAQPAAVKTTAANPTPALTAPARTTPTPTLAGHAAPVAPARPAAAPRTPSKPAQNLPSHVADLTAQVRAVTPAGAPAVQSVAPPTFQSVAQPAAKPKVRPVSEDEEEEIDAVLDSQQSRMPAETINHLIDAIQTGSGALETIWCELEETFIRKVRLVQTPDAVAK